MPCGRSGVDTLTLIADPEHDPAVAGLGEDARGLAAADQDVVRELDLGRQARHVRDRLCARLAGNERQLRKPSRLDGRFEQEREEQAHSRRRQPAPAEPSAALGLLLGQRDRALGVLVSEQPLRGGGDLGEDVRTPETPAQPGNDGFRRQ